MKATIYVTYMIVKEVEIPDGLKNDLEDYISDCAAEMDPKTSKLEWDNTIAMDEDGNEIFSI